MVACTGTPSAASLMPNPASTSACPSAAPPPWLPMAGTMNGSAAKERMASLTILTTRATGDTPREPTAIAMREPDPTPWAVSTDRASAASRRSKSGTSEASNCCRTRCMRGGDA